MKYAYMCVRGVCTTCTYATAERAPVWYYGAQVRRLRGRAPDRRSEGMCMVWGKYAVTQHDHEDRPVQSMMMMDRV